MNLLVLIKIWTAKKTSVFMLSSLSLSLCVEYLDVSVCVSSSLGVFFSVGDFVLV